MFTILLAGLIVVLICVYPVMFAAKKLGAGKYDLVDCCIAILVATLISSLGVSFFSGVISGALLPMILYLLIAGAVFKYMLEATYLAGILIALAPVVIKLLLTAVFT